MKLSIRSMIQAPKGKRFIAFDLSQAESWIVAYLANEPNMKRALLYGDIHTETAGSALFYPLVGCNHEWNKETQSCTKCNRVVSKAQRYVGKRYNHASSYRMGAERAAQVINKDSDKPPYLTVTVRESKQFNAAWHDYYNLKVWWSQIEEQLGKTRTITTVYGRRRTFFNGWGPELFKEATAYEPQSTVADHFNGAVHPILRIRGGLITIYRDLVAGYRDRRIVNQSHDSALLEVPISDVDEMIPQIKQYMLRPILLNNEQFTIPVDVEVGDRYGELEKVA